MYDFYISPEEYKVAEDNGISNVRLEQRIRQFGWKKERALTEPVRKRQDRREWIALAKKNKIGANTFYTRVNSLKMTPERAATEPIHDTMENMRKGHRLRKRYSSEILELLKKNKIKYSTFLKRVSKGMDELEAATMPTMTRQETGSLGWKARGEKMNKRR